ncbi:MAG: TolC family protein [Acidobacteriota bacterium]
MARPTLGRTWLGADRPVFDLHGPSFRGSPPSRFFDMQYVRGNSSQGSSWWSRSFTVLGLAIVGTLDATSSVSAQAESIDVAIVSDGETALTLETKEALIEELLGLGDFENTFRFPDDRQLSHGWNPGRARAAVETALADESIEIVVVLDTVASSVAAGLQPAKPLVAAAVALPELQGFAVEADGTSATLNLHFLASDFDLAGALRDFQRQTSVRHVGLVVDGSLLAAIPSLEAEAERVRNELGFEFSLVEAPSPDSSDLREWAAAVPAGVEALFLTPLPQLSVSRLEQLAELAKELRWPTFTTGGRELVDAGFLLGRELLASPEQLARRIAIDVRDIALGRPASELPVKLSARDRLAINRRTADAIGFRPSFELLFEADVLQEEPSDVPVLSLRSAIDEAIDRNLRLAIAQRDLDIAGEDTALARSSLRPQALGDLGWDRLERDLDPTGGPTRTFDGTFTLSQTIFSETLRGNLRATALAETAESSNRDATELDVIESTALAYLRLLVSLTERDLQLENLNQTRANLERAQVRADVGSANRSEVFRFEAELAADQQAVTSAVAAYDRQRFELNRLLRRPIGRAFQTEEPSIEAARLLSDERVVELLGSPDGVEKLSAFVAEEALRNSPELAALRDQIQAQDRLLLAAKRRRYLPDVDAVSQVSRIFDDDGALFDTDFDTDWRAGVTLTWSLFEGGGITAQRKRSALQLDQLSLTLQRTADLIEADARARLVEAASTRLNIAFAQSSAEAARQTLDLVADSYGRGTARYIDLIDAQNTFLSARLSAANAFYQHLQDLLEVQRAMGFFDFASPPGRESAWLDRLTRFLQSSEDGAR